MTTFLADGFRDVDAVADDDKIVRCLTFLEELPDVCAYKERSIDTLRLRPDSRVADVACGLGFDLLRLYRRVPKGRVTGFDLSSDLVAAARKVVAGHDGIEVRQADAHAIDQPDGTFAAVPSVRGPAPLQSSGPPRGLRTTFDCRAPAFAQRKPRNERTARMTTITPISQKMLPMFQPLLELLQRS